MNKKNSEFTVTNNGIIRQNPYLAILQNWKLRIEYANKLAKKYLVGCHWIDFPEWTLSDEGHKWGPSALHYGKNYYNYAFSCTNEIIRRTDIEKNKGFIPVLSRDTTVFPDVDVIIVADILRPENAKEYIHRHTKCPVIDIYELIL